MGVGCVRENRFHSYKEEKYKKKYHNPSVCKLIRRAGKCLPRDAYTNPNAACLADQAHPDDVTGDLQ